MGSMQRIANRYAYLEKKNRTFFIYLHSPPPSQPHCESYGPACVPDLSRASIGLTALPVADVVPPPAERLAVRPQLTFVMCNHSSCGTVQLIDG